jgi:leucyl/phenylalanyl-tRNA--protein transferase
MFSAQPNASKLALVALSRQLESRGFGLIDCQVHSNHLVSMGAEVLPRRDFQEALTTLLTSKEQPGSWKTPPYTPLEKLS